MNVQQLLLIHALCLLLQAGAGTAFQYQGRPRTPIWALLTLSDLRKSTLGIFKFTVSALLLPAMPTWKLRSMLSVDAEPLPFQALRHRCNGWRVKRLGIPSASGLTFYPGSGTLRLEREKDAKT